MFSVVKFTINEHKKNWKILLKLAYVHMSQATSRSTWGVVWVYIHDILYFTAFTLFRILLTGNRQVEEVSSVEYLMTGLVPWLIISEVLNGATNAIRNNKVIVQSIHFPIIILPGVEVIAILLKRLPSFLFILITCAYYGHLKNFNIVLFLYYLIAMIVLLWALTLFLSALIAVSDDFHQLYMAFVKILFFTLPIMWDYKLLETTPYAVWGSILKLNPLIYIIEGFRDAFVLGNTQSYLYGIYFWIFAWICFWLGCLVQKRMQRFYADFV